MDIWVDSPASVAGGRALWAIPKGLCDFTFETSHTGPFSRTDVVGVAWSGVPIASASFSDVSRAAPRVPFKGGTWQPGIDDTDGQDRTATLRGSSKTLPCRGRWEFHAGRAAGLAVRRAATRVVPDGGLPDDLRLSSRSGDLRQLLRRAGGRTNVPGNSVLQMCTSTPAGAAAGPGLAEVEGQAAGRTAVGPLDLLRAPRASTRDR